jgi:hypothetical protein
MSVWWVTPLALRKNGASAASVTDSTLPWADPDRKKGLRDPMQGTAAFLIAGLVGGLSGIYLGNQWCKRVLIKHISELESLDTQEDRAALFEYLCDRVTRRPESSGRITHDITMFLLRQALEFGPGVVFICGAGLLPVPLWVTMLLFAAVYVPLQLIVVLWIEKWRIRKLARDYILLRGRPMCLSCGYDLRGQEVPRCPECGWECDARVRGIMRVAKMRKERS